MRIEEIFKIYDESKNRILLYLEASVPSEQFRALRKLILDELGLSGAQGKVKKLFEEWQGQARAESRKGGGGNG